MDIGTLATSPRNERGDGQVSYLLLTKGQFGSRHLSVTWVECQPDSQQAIHSHPSQEQVYVIVRGRARCWWVRRNARSLRARWCSFHPTRRMRSGTTTKSF
jgi:mannose-6-phosphate isomerase-like protein (cupin superfamily)